MDNGQDHIHTQSLWFTGLSGIDECEYNRAVVQQGSKGAFFMTTQFCLVDIFHSSVLAYRYLRRSFSTSQLLHYIVSWIVLQ